MKNLCDLHTGHEQTLGDLWVKKETLDGWPWLLTKMCTGTPPLREPIWIGDHRSIYIHPGFTNSSSGILSKLILYKGTGILRLIDGKQNPIPTYLHHRSQVIPNQSLCLATMMMSRPELLDRTFGRWETCCIPTQHICKWNPKHVMSMNHDCWTPHTPKSKFPSPHSLRLLQPTRWCEESESKSKNLGVPHMRRMGKVADSK